MFDEKLDLLSAFFLLIPPVFLAIVYGGRKREEERERVIKSIQFQSYQSYVR
jgi:hypothetical protein